MGGGFGVPHGFDCVLPCRIGTLRVGRSLIVRGNQGELVMTAFSGSESRNVTRARQGMTRLCRVVRSKGTGAGNDDNSCRRRA